MPRPCRRYAAFLQNAPIRSGATQGLPWAGMRCPVGAFNTQNAPIRCGLEGVYEVPMADVERLLQVAITVTDEFHVGLKDICGA